MCVRRVFLWTSVKATLYLRVCICVLGLGVETAMHCGMDDSLLSQSVQLGCGSSRTNWDLDFRFCGLLHRDKIWPILAHRYLFFQPKFSSISVSNMCFFSQVFVCTKKSVVGVSVISMFYVSGLHGPAHYWWCFIMTHFDCVFFNVLLFAERWGSAAGSMCWLTEISNINKLWLMWNQWCRHKLDLITQLFVLKTSIWLLLFRSLSWKTDAYKFPIRNFRSDLFSASSYAQIGQDTRQRIQNECFPLMLIFWFSQVSQVFKFDI